MSAEETPTKEPLPSIPRRSRNHDAWVGLLVIVGVVATLTSLFTFTDAGMFRGRYNLVTVVRDAGGVRKGDPVQLRGVNVGRVRDFEITPDGVQVRLEIEKGFRVPVDSQVRIRPAGLMSGMVVEIEPGSSSVMARSGAVLPGLTEPNPLDSASSLADESEAVLRRVRALLSERTVEGIETSSVELSELMTTLSETATEQHQALGTLVQSFQRSATNVERVTQDPAIARSIDRVGQMIDTATTATPKLVHALALLEQSAGAVGRVTTQVERGGGTIGKLTQDDALYLNANQAMIGANQTIAEIRRLAEDIRLHPKRYFSVKLF
jgi:phospholipid/cholesterol/gamma-HCH transport system substrate-binding protein